MSDSKENKISTVRGIQNLPQVPDEKTAAAVLSAIEMVRAKFDASGQLVFQNSEDFDQALDDGFFLLEMPSDINLDAADAFAETFYDATKSEKNYRELDFPGDYQGYFDRPHDQWENLYVERSNWSMLPKDVAKAGDQLAHIGISILRSVLAHLEISAVNWDEITGGLTARRGHQMLAFNHFRSQKRARGCKMHRDSGWVTVLRSTEPGLIAYIDGDLKAVNPKANCLIVNFGSSIEVLTEHLNRPVRANIHGVTQTVRDSKEKDRHSYTLFLDSDLNGNIYKIIDDDPIPAQSVAEFAIQEVQRTYDGFDEIL